MNGQGSDVKRWMNPVIGVLVLGSLWGLAEVVISGAWGLAGLPWRSAVLTGISMGLMGVAVAGIGRAWAPVGMALVAILCKQMVVPILGVALSCKANSCFAVGMAGLVVSGVAAVVGRRKMGHLTGAALGSGAAAVSAGLFYVGGIRLAPCAYLSSFANRGGLPVFMGAEGVPWAIASALLFPLGLAVGHRLADGWLARWSQRAVYAASAIVVVLSWAASAVAIAAGF